MRLVMCTDCGEFVKAVPDGGAFRPSVEACPECDGREFKDNESGHVFSME